MLLRAFQHTPAAVLHMTLPPLCSKPLKEPLVLQGTSEAPFIRIHCIPALSYTYLHTQLSPDPEVPLTYALSASHTWNAFPALPHMGSYVILQMGTVLLLPSMVYHNHSTDEETEV